MKKPISAVLAFVALACTQQVSVLPVHILVNAGSPCCRYDRASRNLVPAGRVSISRDTMVELLGTTFIFERGDSIAYRIYKTPADTLYINADSTLILRRAQILTGNR